jgi:hypothetical protein
MVHFREVQHFRQFWLWALLLAGLAPVALGLYWQIGRGRRWGNHPASDATLVAVHCLVLLLLAWFYLVKLVTEVDDDEIRAQFVYMWRAKRIPFSQIRKAEAVTYRPIRDYGGWGIRMGPAGWAYNVSGNRGVRIDYNDGNKFLIGSQRPEELEQAIQARLRPSS